MVDTLLNRELVVKLGEFIKENLGEDTVCLDVSEKSSFADYMVITTVSSGGRLRGVLKHVKHFLYDHGVEARNSKKKLDSDNWVLLDCGNLVIHMFSKEKREFYELEKLWFDSEVIYDDYTS